MTKQIPVCLNVLQAFDKITSTGNSPYILSARLDKGYFLFWLSILPMWSCVAKVETYES